MDSSAPIKTRASRVQLDADTILQSSSSSSLPDPSVYVAMITLEVRVQWLKQPLPLSICSEVSVAEALEILCSLIPETERDPAKEENLCLFIPATGVRMEPDRPLSSYLLKPKDKIEAKAKTQQASRTIKVEVPWANVVEEIVTLPETTLYGIIQSIKNKQNPAGNSSLEADIRRQWALFHKDTMLADLNATTSSFQIGNDDVLVFRQKNLQDRLASITKQPLLIQISIAPGTPDEATKRLKVDTGHTFADVKKKLQPKVMVPNKEEFLMYVIVDGHQEPVDYEETLGERHVKNNDSIIWQDKINWIAPPPTKLKNRRSKGILDQIRSKGKPKERSGSKLEKRCDAVEEDTSQLIATHLMFQICLWIEKNALSTQGIFRVSGNQSDVESFYSQFESGVINLEKMHENHHVVACALKLALRKMDPICTYDLYSSFIEEAKKEDESVPQGIKEVTHKLPERNILLLKCLFATLKMIVGNSDVNMMSENNLAIVFGPTLLRAKTETKETIFETEYVNKAIRVMLENYEDVFGSDYVGEEDKRPAELLEMLGQRKEEEAEAGDGEGESEEASSPSVHPPDMRKTIPPPLSMAIKEKAKSTKKKKSKVDASTSTTPAPTKQPKTPKGQESAKKKKKADKGGASTTTLPAAVPNVFDKTLSASGNIKLPDLSKVAPPPHLTPQVDPAALVQATNKAAEAARAAAEAANASAALLKAAAESALASARAANAAAAAAEALALCVCKDVDVAPPPSSSSSPAFTPANPMTLVSVASSPNISRGNNNNKGRFSGTATTPPSSSSASQSSSTSSSSSSSSCCSHESVANQQKQLIERLMNKVKELEKLQPQKKSGRPGSSDGH